MKVKYAASFDTTVLEKRTYEVRRNDATLCTHYVLCDLEAMVFNEGVGCEKNTGYKYICYSLIIYLDLFLGLPVALGSVLAFPSKAFVQIFLKFCTW